MEGQQLKNSLFCRRIILLTTFTTGVTNAYAFGCLNPMNSVIHNLYNETYQNRYQRDISDIQWTTLLSLTMSTLIVGGFCGSVTAHFVLKIFGQKQTMILWNIIHIIGSVIITTIAGTIGSYEAFICGRFVIGYSLGISINTAPIIVAEFSVYHKREKYQSTIGIFLTFGGVLGTIAAHQQVLGSNDRWTAVVGLSCAFSIFYLICSPWIPESPFRLLRRGRRDEALEVLKKLRVGSEDKVLMEIKIMEREQLWVVTPVDSNFENNDTKETAQIGIIEILKNGRFRRQLLTVCMLYSGAMAMGTNHVLLYSNRIFVRAGIPRGYVSYATIGLFSTQFIGVAFSAKTISLHGCRKVLLVSTIGVIVSHVIIVTSLSAYRIASLTGYVSIVGTIVLFISFSGGIMTTIFGLAGQLTIEPTRQTILNYAGGCFWFSSWLVGFSAPYLDILMGPYSFLVWCGISIIYFIAIYIFVPETKGKSIEEFHKTPEEPHNNTITITTIM